MSRFVPRLFSDLILRSGDFAEAVMVVRLSTFFAASHSFAARCQQLARVLLPSIARAAPRHEVIASRQGASVMCADTGRSDALSRRLTRCELLTSLAGCTIDTHESRFRKRQWSILYRRHTKTVASLCKLRRIQCPYSPGRIPLPPGVTAGVFP
jgi:hypothetical protein